MAMLRPSRRVGVRCGRAAFLVACALLAGCGGLPEPDGIEAAIIEKSRGLSPLAPSRGQDARSTARNGLLRNPSVREAASRVSAGADEVRVQRAALFPGLSLSLGGGVGDAGSGDAALQLEASQLLFDNGNSKRAVRVADFDLQISYIAFQQAVDDALVDVLKAYDMVQMRRDLLEVYRKQLGALSELEKLVAARVERGAAASTDLLETRKRLQSAAFLVNDAELALAEAQDRLVLLSGQEQGGPVTMGSAVCKTRGETDDLRMARLERARAQLALETAEHARSPRISLKPLVRSEIGSDGLPVGLNLDVQSDLLKGGALSARVNAAHNSLMAAEAQLDVVQLEDDMAERALVRKLAVGERKTQMLNRQIALLSETRTLYRSQYFDMGTRQISELLDNEEEYYARQAELAELRSDIAGARLDCSKLGRSLRSNVGLEGNSLFGFPLSPDI